MKRIAALLTALFVCAFLFAGAAMAEEVKVVAVITTIDLAADGASAVVTLTDNKTGNPVEVLVKDELTLDKFKDHRIVPGDEIRLKYEVEDGKNLSKYFRKTAGC